MAEDIHNDNWESEAPILASLKGKTGPEAPEGYFATFPENLMAKIRESELPVEQLEPVQMPSRRPFLKWVGVAAAVTLLATASWLLIRDTQPAAAPDNLLAQTATFSRAELIHAVNLSDIPTDEIIEAMGDEALANISLSPQPQGEELNQYLDENPMQDLNLDGIDLSDSALLEFLNI